MTINVTVRQAPLRLTLRAEYAFPNAYSGFNLSDRWQLRPGVRYQLLTSDINMNETNHQFDLSYFNLGLGVAWRF